MELQNFINVLYNEVWFDICLTYLHIENTRNKYFMKNKPLIIKYDIINKINLSNSGNLFWTKLKISDFLLLDIHLAFII